MAKQGQLKGFTKVNPVCDSRQKVVIFITSLLCCLLPIWLPSFSCSTLLKKCSFMILSKRSLRLSRLLHFSVKCFKSRTPVEAWKTKSLLTHPVSQLSLSYSLLEKVHVYAFPQSMDCCWLKAGSGPPTTLKCQELANNKCLFLFKTEVSVLCECCWIVWSNS